MGTVPIFPPPAPKPTIQSMLNDYWITDASRDFRMRYLGHALIEDYLKELPEPYNEIALAYLDPRNEHYKVSSMKEALELAFYWDETTEGTGFWLQLLDALNGKAEYPEFEIELIDGPAKGKRKAKKSSHLLEVKEYIKQVGDHEYELVRESLIYKKIMQKGTPQYKFCPNDGMDWTKPDYVEYVPYA